MQASQQFWGAPLVYVTVSGRSPECCPSCLMGPEQSCAVAELLQLILTASVLQRVVSRRGRVSKVTDHAEVWPLCSGEPLRPVAPAGF